jgi:hypothetical protein
MGLITGLLTLPLAPVRGTMWLASVIQARAEQEAFDEPAILEALAELDAARADGAFSEEEIEEAEDALLEQLLVVRGVDGEERYGRFE